MILEFNYAMRYIVQELNKELTDFNIIFCDAYDGSTQILKNFRHFGEIFYPIKKLILLNLHCILSHDKYSFFLC